MSDTVKHLIQDKLTGTAGTAGTSVTSAATALNLDSIIDQISLYGGALVMITVLVVNYYTIQSFRSKKKREHEESQVRIKEGEARLRESEEKAAYYKGLAEKETVDKDLALYDLAITRKVVEAMGKGDQAHEEAAKGIESQVIQMREVRENRKEA